MAVGSSALLGVLADIAGCLPRRLGAARPTIASALHVRNLPLWWLTKDGDRACLELYRRHYSWLRKPGQQRKAQFVGPGEKVVLRTEHADAMFVWRKFFDRSGQTGVNCAVFRNESAHRSSELIRQACAVANCLWPDSRHYTYVSAKNVRSTNPGFCFIAAGWRRCGTTGSGLIVLELLPNNHDYGK